MNPELAVLAAVQQVRRVGVTDPDFALHAQPDARQRVRPAAQHDLDHVTRNVRLQNRRASNDLLRLHCDDACTCMCHILTLLAPGDAFT